MVQKPASRIKPSQIAVVGSYNRLFKDPDDDHAAQWIVEFCQRRNHNSWEPFRVSDLQAYYEMMDLFPEENGFNFHRLPARGYVKISNGICTVSPAFVAGCYLASPA